jgi:hypothetical protein
MYTYIFQTYTHDRNWEFIDVIFLLVHNMFRPLLAIFRWNTITLLIYLEKAIDITMEPLFHNLSLIIYLYKGKCIINSQLRSRVYVWKIYVM